MVDMLTERVTEMEKREREYLLRNEQDRREVQHMKSKTALMEKGFWGVVLAAFTVAGAVIMKALGLN